MDRNIRKKNAGFREPHVYAYRDVFAGKKLRIFQSGGNAYPADAVNLHAPSPLRSVSILHINFNISSAFHN